MSNTEAVQDPPQRGSEESEGVNETGTNQGQVLSDNNTDNDSVRTRNRPGSTSRTNVPLPRPLSVKGDMKKNWGIFTQMWDSYEVITGLEHESNKIRVAHFITALGTDALEIQQGLPFRNEEERKSYKCIRKLWSEYCVGQTNITFERYQFNKCVQNTDESVENYYVRLRSLASTCEFGTLTDDLIRDRIVLGIRDDNTRKRLLQEPNLTLSSCLDICRAMESSKAQSKAMQEPVSAYAVSHKPKVWKHSGGKGKKLAPKVINCGFCGRQHEKDKSKCPAYGQKCKLCKRENHFAVKCRQNKNKAHRVETIEEDEDSEQECVYVSLIGTDEAFQVSADSKSPNYQKKIIAKFRINDEDEIGMQVDCGATCNVIHLEDVPSGTELTSTNQVLIVYGQGTVPVAGKCKLHLRNVKNNKRYLVPFVVVKGEVTRPLLGASTGQQMKLIKVQYENIEVVHAVANDDILIPYKDVFTGLGNMPGVVHLTLEAEAKPVVMPPRRVPLSIKEDLKEELCRLEKLQVIEKVEDPSDWVSSLVVARKPSGKLRVCIDPQHLNRSLKREHYPLSTIDDVLPQLANVKVFSKADLKEGFLQCKLDAESSKLTTFQTPWGRYRYLRLPFGLSPSPELFQKRLDQCLEGLPGVFVIADDILITGQGETHAEACIDHDRNMTSFLRRCRERDIKLNSSKLEYKCKEVQFIGHRLTKEGVRPDPSKVAALVDMPQPVDIPGIQRFVGMVQYLAKFLPSLSGLSEPLRRLTHKDTPWNWGEEQSRAFIAIKGLVTEAPVLRYFDQQLPVEGQGDASQKGLGFVLTQNDQPVTYSSRALTEAETRYSQIEKELLAQVFGLERNHQYVYGRKVILWTDHKPLVTITRKPLASTPKRLQRLLLRMQQYNVEILYKPGREMYLADTLSRAYLPNSEQSPTEKEVESIHMLEDIAVSQKTLALIRIETQQDESLQAVKGLILEGWPEDKSRLPPGTSPYFDIRDELTYDEGIIFRGQRCVIPVKVRPRVKQRLHSAHTGIQATLARARECVFWPGMTSDLTDYLSHCEVCATFAPKQRSEPLINHDLPKRPWQKLGIDLFELNNKNYVCVVDYFSDYFEVLPLPHKKDTRAVVRRLKSIFACHGIPETIMSDNGPPFNSQDFATFMQEYEIEHITSSPYYPKSNGKAESAVKIAKGLLRKTTEAQEDFQLALLNWRNTPTAGLDSSPAQRLYGRRTRTLVPTASKLLIPRTQIRVVAKKAEKQKKQKQYYDKSTKELPPLKRGDIVRVQPQSNAQSKRWHKARVEKQVDSRSYLVRSENGNIVRRNRKHLRTCSSTFSDQSDIFSTPTSVTREQPEPSTSEAKRSDTNSPDHVAKSPRREANNDIREPQLAEETQEPPRPARRSTRARHPPAHMKDFVVYH